MSTYTKITRHPRDGKYYEAIWHDDYFAPHFYGVEFPEDKVIYPGDFVKGKQLKEFWVADVIEALRIKTGPESVLPFLEVLDRVYKERWERDPIGGEGALGCCAKRYEDTDPDAPEGAEV